jgi:hypothetical protein
MPPKDEPAGGVIAADVHEPRGDASARHKDGEGRQAGACVDQGAVPRLKLFGSQTSRGLGEVDGVVRTGSGEPSLNRPGLNYCRRDAPLGQAMPVASSVGATIRKTSSVATFHRSRL